jgi:hypothetical protein
VRQPRWQRVAVGGAVALGLFACSVAPTLAAAPANDTFDNAKVVGALPYADSVNTAEATSDSDDAAGNCRFSGPSVWYSFTASSNARIEVNGEGSGFVACIDVFTGTKGALVEQAYYGYRIRFNATNGTAYHLMVAGYPGGTLNVSVHVAPPPPANDDFDDAEPISSLPFTDTVDTYDATRAVDDPSCPGVGNGEHTVWYSFIAPADERVDIDPRGSPREFWVPTACVYTGSRGSLSLVAVTHRSEKHFRFDVADGTTYFVFLSVDFLAYDASTLDVTQAPPPPPNDDFDNATVIGSLPYSDSEDTTEATFASDDPGGLASSVWYAFTPTHETRVTPTALGSPMPGYSPSVSVWTGARGALISVTPVDIDAQPYEYDAQAGTTYYFLVGNLYTTLGGQLDFSLDGSFETALGLSTSRASINYKRSITVTTHLADFGDLTVKSVSIYKTPYGGAKTLVTTGDVDSLGNLSAVVTLTKNTKFVAEWAGEDGWLPASSLIRTVGVHVITSTKISGNYAISGKYKLFHLGHAMKQTGTVVPNHAGKYLKFIAQRYVSGAWRASASASFRIRSTGSATAYLTTGRGTFRTRNVFAGDADHLGDASAWKYFRVT